MAKVERNPDGEWQKQAPEQKPARTALEQLSDEYQSSVFRIDTESSSGTGWAIDKNTVVTDYHVIANKREMVGRNAAGEVFRLGKEVWVDPTRDLAMLTIEGARPAVMIPLKLGRSRDLKPGDPVLSVGWKGGESLGAFPGHYQGKMTELEMFKQIEAGAVSGEEKRYARERTEQATSRDRSGNGRHFIELKNETGPGASGGPDVDKDGKVVGVIAVGLPNQPGRALSNPVENVRNLYEHRERFQKLEGSYETGLGMAIRSGIGDPKTGFLNLMGVSTASAGAVAFVHGFGGAAAGMKYAVPGVLGALGIGALTQSDMASFISSSASLDKTKYATAIVFDGALLSSLTTATLSKRFPGLRMASRILLGLGALGRTATELIPNRFVVDIGDSRPY